jgi:hypothetical protein
MISATACCSRPPSTAVSKSSIVKNSLYMGRFRLRTTQIDMAVNGGLEQQAVAEIIQAAPPKVGMAACNAGIRNPPKQYVPSMQGNKYQVALAQITTSLRTSETSMELLHLFTHRLLSFSTPFLKCSLQRHLGHHHSNNIRTSVDPLAHELDGNLSKCH